MPEFEYRFVNPKTGRKNKGKRRAFDEAELREILSREGVDADEVVRLPGPAATERQLELLVDRGVSPPSPLTMGEASDLITNLLERRVVADQEDFRIAAAMRTEVSRFASKSAIYRSILHRLVERNNDADLGAWYAYRVASGSQISEAGRARSSHRAPNVDAGAFASEPARAPPRESGAFIKWAVVAVFALLIVLWLLK